MNAAHQPRVEAAAAVRAELWDAGFLPVALYSYDCRHSWLRPEDPGKRPKGDRWEERARHDPPEAAVSPPELDALETGILADGLRIFDLDLNDAATVAQSRAVIIKHGGDTVVRWRENSPRIAMVYKAAEGQPQKRVLRGRLGKVEVLGCGQQLAAFGKHPSGADLRWAPEAPTSFPRHTLPALTEEQVTAILAEIAPIIGATEQDKRAAAGAGGLPHTPSVLGPSADPLDVTAALAVIPNDGSPDWEFWNKIGMATYAATGGGLVGFAAWMAWSEHNPTHDPALCQERWNHYPKAEPSSIGAGTLFHMAREARPEWVRPTDLNGSPAAALIERARKAGQRSSENGDTPHDDTAGPASGTTPPEEDINAQEEVQDLCNRIEERCASNKTLAKRWRGDWSGLTGNAPSHRAFALVAALRRAGFDFREASVAVRLHRDLAEWAQTNGARELGRIWRALLKRDAEQGVEQEENGELSYDERINATIESVVATFNERYLVVNEAGKAVIYQPGVDPILHRRRFDRLSFQDLRALYLNDQIETGISKKTGEPEFKSVATVWLGHPNRRQFIHGVEFNPTRKGSREGVLNLWEGFAVEPKPGDWSRLREHIRTVICGGDQEHFEYLLNWMARMVQHPAEQGEVAVVLKGGEGSGKGTLAKIILRLMGQHGLAVSNAKHLIGNFNGHLRDAVFLFCDEAFFAGDRAHVGVLKSLITEPYLTVEAKFQNAVQQPNFLHVMMASNEEWVVPASMDARRFFVLVVSEAKKNDHAYFAAIWEQMEAGGYNAMLHDLLNLDLTMFNVRAVPTTEGLHQQRKLSLGTTEAWWMDCLERGYVFRSKLGLEEHFAVWHEKVTTELLFASYMEFANARRERHPLSREVLGRFLAETGAKPKRLFGKEAVVGEHMKEETNAYGHQERKPALLLHPRPPGYHLGDLDAARTAFLEATGLGVTWPDAVCCNEDVEVEP